MRLTRREFIAKTAMGALAVALPLQPGKVFGEPKTMKRMPVLFVGHGSPMNAIEKTSFSEKWKAIGEKLPKPSAILCISAHWETDDLRITASERPETIYDFWGFPEALYKVVYPASGSPQLAKSLLRIFAENQIVPDPTRGLDHGCWAVLARMFPEADIPVVQLSLNQSLSPRAQCELARQLSPLREDGVLIIGSGNIVHNLLLMKPKEAPPYDWALKFDGLAKTLIQRGDLQTLLEYDRLGESGRLSIPTDEHYLPALYAVALREDSEPVAFFNEGIVSGSVSMRGFRIG